MKLVEFARDMRPYVKGETRAMPDDLADKLISAGDAIARPSVFDGRPDEPPALPRRAHYLTRRRR
jgi:hypothetical protein